MGRAWAGAGFVAEGGVDIDADVGGTEVGHVVEDHLDEAQGDGVGGVERGRDLLADAVDGAELGVG